MFVEERDGDIGIWYALYQGHTKDAGQRLFYVRRQQSVRARDKQKWEGCRRVGPWLGLFSGQQCRTFVVVLFRGALAKLPPPRGQVAARGCRLWSCDGCGLGIPIAHARSVGVCLRAGGHGRRAEERRSSPDDCIASVGAIAASCGVVLSRHRWAQSGQAAAVWGGRYVTSTYGDGARAVSGGALLVFLPEIWCAGRRVTGKQGSRPKMLKTNGRRRKRRSGCEALDVSVWYATCGRQWLGP